MNKDKLMRIILAPCTTEKTMSARADRVYVFRVRTDAAKQQIAQAVKLMFAVEVDAVRTVNVRGKARRFSNIQGRRKDWKKAYVTIKEGQVINLGGV